MKARESSWLLGLSRHRYTVIVEDQQIAWFQVRCTAAMAIAKFTRSSSDECDSFLRVHTPRGTSFITDELHREVARTLVEVHDLVLEKLEFTKRDWQSNSVSRTCNWAAAVSRNTVVCVSSSRKFSDPGVDIVLIWIEEWEIKRELYLNIWLTNGINNKN